MLRQSRSFNHSLEKPSATAQQSQNQTLALMFAQQIFGVMARTHFVTCDCFIPTRPAIAPQLSKQPTKSMRTYRDSMVRGSAKSNLVCSHPAPCVHYHFSTTGNRGRECNPFYNRFSFAIVRSAILCIRGSRFSFHQPSSLCDTNIDLVVSEGQLSIL